MKTTIQIFTTLNSSSVTVYLDNNSFNENILIEEAIKELKRELIRRKSKLD